MRLNAAFQQLAATITGRVLSPEDSEYGLRSQPWNARFADLCPAAVVMAASARDVSAAIVVAREHELPFAIRSGGHCFSGYSASAGIVIDVSELVSIDADPANERATVGAGWRMLPMYEALWPTKMTIPAGTCPTVGIAGLGLAGGFGRLSPLHGLTCDNVLAVEIVTADGKIVTASESENTDLLWATRGGGGGNFGAITQLTARLRPVDMPFTEIQYEFPLAMGVAVLVAWQDWIGELPRYGHSELLVMTGVPADGAGATVKVDFTLAGPEEHAAALGRELLAAIGAKPRSEQVVTAPFLSIERAWACAGLHREQCAFRGISESGELPRTSLYAKCDLVNNPWPAEGFERIVDAIARRQADSIMTPLDFDPAANVGKLLLESAGGAINEPHPEDTAFVHRSIRYVAQYQSRWLPGASNAVADTNIAWTNAMYDAVAPWLSGNAYHGYIDTGLRDWQHAYYGANLPRLQAIKRKFDPDNVFRHGQSIAPEVALRGD